MIIKSLFVQNFMAFEEARLAFTEYEGVTLIEGKSDSASRDSNGSGKSTILNAISWVLYGKILQKQKNVESVVNRFNADKRTLGIVELSVNGRDITVERSRYKGVPGLRISGLDSGKATSKGTQEQLEEALGMDFRLFTSAVMFGGMTSSFCSMTDADRKRVLEEMLDFDRFLAAQARAKTLLEEAEESVSTSENDIRTLKDVIIELVRQKDSLKKDAENFETERDERLAEAIKSHQDDTEKLETAMKCLQDARKEYDDVRTKYDEEHPAWKEKNKELSAASEEAEEDEQKASNAVAEAQALVREAKKQLEKIKPDSHPDVCPTCGQRWPKKNEGAMENMLKQNQKIVDERETELAAARKNHLQLGETANTIAEKLDKQKETEPEHPGEKDEYVRDFAHAYDTAVRAHDVSLKECERIRKEQNPYEGKDAELKKKLESKAAKVEALEEGIKGTAAKILNYRYWEKAFGKNGIPSHMTDAAVPSMNESVSAICDILTDGELRVYFDPATAKGSGSIFDVKVEYVDGGESYEMASRGEKSRIDLAVLLAIRELLAKQGKIECNQVWVDEVFDGLDSHGIQAVMRLLRQRYKDVSFFVVSHDSELKSYADSVITVEKKDGVSHIV